MMLHMALQLKKLYEGDENREEQVTETQKSPAKKQEMQFGVTVVFIVDVY